MSQRPKENEHSSYFALYIRQAKGDQILDTLDTGEKDLITYLESLPIEKWDHKYAPDKWTIKEAVIHIIDTERIFAYRALRIGRRDPTPLRGFDQNDYVPFYQADKRTPASLIEEYRSVRHASRSLFLHFSEEDLLAMGTASDQPVSCRALAFMIAGHEQHHLSIFKERY